MRHNDCKRTNKEYTLAAVIICVCFTVFSFLFLIHMVQENERENIEYLNNAARQNQSTIQKQIYGDFQTLKGIAVCLGDMEISSSEQIMHILQRINDGNSFIRMGFADTDGNLELVEIGGERIPHMNLSNYAFFQKALNGEPAISETIKDSQDSFRYINYYGIEIRNRKHEIIGVLCAVNSAFVLQDIIDSPLLNGAGYSEIIDGKGQFVIRSSHSPGYKEKVQSLASVTSLNIASLEQLIKIADHEEMVNFTMVANNKEQLAMLQPLGVNDWQLLSLIPKEVLRDRYIQTAIGVIIIIILSCIIFSLLLSQQRKIMSKNQKELMDLAFTDDLTGHMNFSKFKIDAEALLKKEGVSHYAFWYCDLKKFKFFNDMFGYDNGDIVLQHMTELIERYSGSDTLFCRISADNFTGIRSYGSQEELSHWFYNLVEFIHHGEVLFDKCLHFDLCMGFYCLEPEDKDVSMDALVNRAIMAQKSVKEMPGSNYAFYNKKIRDQVIEESELETQAVAALKNGEFIPYLQPKVNIQNGNYVGGVEVLSRWCHPVKGLVSPDKFIPLFEKNGMIVELDRYMFNYICEWFQRYLNEGHIPINIAINVSRMGLFQEDFIDYYVSVKKQYHIPDGLLELEFTESVALNDDHLFLNTVHRLQEQGFICSIDDFGTGYSSLNMLKNLPINVLKLDIMFFRSSNSVERERIVISNIINMAKELNIKTIAEGVEIPEVVDFLREAGCDLVQGYVFSKPLPLSKIEKLLYNMEGQPFSLSKENHQETTESQLPHEIT